MAGCIEVIAPDAAGMYADGVVTLFADNIKPGDAWGVFLHEAGEHAGLADMLGEKKYAQAVAQFERLLEAEDFNVLAAAGRVPASTPAEHVDSERLAYLIEDFANTTGKTRGLVQRVIAAVKAWVFDKLPSWITKGVKLTAADFQALAIRAARSWSDQVISRADNEGAQVDTLLDDIQFSRTGKDSRTAAQREFDEAIMEGVEPVETEAEDVKLGVDESQEMPAKAARSSSDEGGSGIFRISEGADAPLRGDVEMGAKQTAENNGNGQFTSGDSLVSSREGAADKSREGKNRPLRKTTGGSKSANDTGGNNNRLRSGGGIKAPPSEGLVGSGAQENSQGDEGNQSRKTGDSVNQSSDVDNNQSTQAEKANGQPQKSQNQRDSVDNSADLWAEADADAQDAPKFRTKVWDAIRKKSTELAKNGGLGTLTMRQLIEIGEKMLPSMARYSDRVDAMMMKRNARMDEAAKLGTFWAKLSKADNRRVSWLMHESTKEGVDASLGEFVPSEVLIEGGMDAVRGADPSLEGGVMRDAVRVPATEENMALLRQRRIDGNRRFKGQSGAGLDRRVVLRYQAEEKLMRNALLRDKQRAKAYPRLRAHFLDAPEAAQQVYTRARDMHTERLNEAQAALMAIVEKETADMSSFQQKQAMAAIRLDFETARVEGIYFPLGRTGDYFVRYERPTGEAVTTYRPKNSGQRVHAAVGDGKATWGTMEAAMRSASTRADLLGKNVKAVPEGDGFILQDKGTVTVFERFDSALDAETQAAKMRKDGMVDVRQGRLAESKVDDAVGVGEFASGALGILKQEGVSEEVQNAVYQHYLQFLPSLSMRKAFIHRKKTPGYLDDALNVFARSMMHQAHQISKLEASGDLRDILDEVAAEARELEGGYDPATGEVADATLAGNLREELKLRHEWVMNPQNGVWTSWTSAAGFLWYLGASPAAALVNLSQTAAVAFPVLGAKFGFKQSARALKEAAKLLDGAGVYRETKKVFSRNDAPDLDLVLKRSGLSDEEVTAFRDWQELGVHDVTNAHMLAGIGDTDSISSSIGFQKTMGKVAHFFQTAEMLNREVTLLAGYRLAREGGQSHQEAVRFAAKVTWDSHFDYGNHNRARVMQSDTAKVLLMFKSYGQHMMFHLVRNAYKAGKGDKAATRTIMGTLAVTALLGGVTALPLGYTTAAPAGYAYLRSKYGEQAANITAAASVMVLWGAMAALDDEDEPFEFGAEVRKALRGVGGEFTESLVMDGVVNAFTGADLSGRISLGDIVVRDSNRELEGRDAATYWIEQLAGPVVGIATKQMTAVGMAQDGHWWRGIESSLPKFMADPMKALRYANEGALNMNGAPVKETDLLSVFGDDLNAWDVFLRANGFGPQRLSRQYRENSDLKNAEGQLKKRRARLMQAYYVAYMARDRGEMVDIRRELMEFGRKNPALKVDAASVQASLKGKIRAAKLSDNGIYMSQKYREAVE